MTKSLQILACLALVTGCGVFGAKSPCPGVWCVEVSTVPGPALCYDTEAKMLQAKQAFEAKGATVTVVPR